MDFDPSTPPKKHNVFLPMILSFVLVLGIWVGYMLNQRISNRSNFTNGNQTSTNEKINALQIDMMIKPFQTSVLSLTLIFFSFNVAP